MNTLIQSKIFNKSFTQIKYPFILNPLLLNLNPLQKTQNFPKYYAIDESEEKSEIKLAYKKRGRKNKEKENNSEIKEEENMIIHDKFSNDNIKRKLKALYHNYIINLLNNLIKKNYKEYKIKFVKINSKITKEIGIEFNLKLLNKKIKDIIIDISDKYQNKENNKQCLKYIEKQKNNENIIKILNMSYKDLYTNYYLKSIKADISFKNSFEANKEKLLELYGQEYLNRFIENAEKFVEFFTKGKKRKSRKKQKFEILNNNSENDSIETTNYNEQVNNDNIEVYYTNKNMVSLSTQTDICGINNKIIVLDKPFFVKK